MMKLTLRTQQGLPMLMLSVALMTANAPAVEATVTTLGRFSLSADEEAFWDGPAGLTWADPNLLDDPNPELDCADARPCIEYELELLEPAFRLRVAMDTPDQAAAAVETNVWDAAGDGFYLALYDPAGELVALTRYGEDPWHAFSGEAAAEIPTPGIWRARVVPVRVTDATFRMRAKLEALPPGDHGDELLYPNLRMTPPFEFAFLPSPPAPPGGCVAGECTTGPCRCLRFSFGPENIVGPNDIGGPLELIFQREGYSDSTGGITFQRISRSDGTFEEVEAGTYEYHAEHGHYHHDWIAGAWLYRVTDPEGGTLELAGESPKIGFCMGDIAIIDWDRFSNSPGPVENGSGCEPEPMEEGRTGLSRGWADIYPFYIEGNTVNLGANPDGLYVLRLRANADDSIHETTTADNFSYALIEVHGDSIAVLERGYGTDPWDPGKQPADDIRNELAFEDGFPMVSIPDLTSGALPAQVPAFRALPPVTSGTTFLAFGHVLTTPATIGIYDVSGRLIRSIGVREGADGVTWDGRTANGRQVRSGFYFARLAGSTQPAVARIVVTR